jgi:hypothetical protein
MEMGSSSDGFVRDYRMAPRFSGCCVAHLGFTACAATHTGDHVKVCALGPGAAYVAKDLDLAALKPTHVLTIYWKHVFDRKEPVSVD